MSRLEDELFNLQEEFQDLHRNYGKMPRWEFMLQSVRIVDQMRLIEKLIS